MTRGTVETAGGLLVVAICGVAAVVVALRAPVPDRARRATRDEMRAADAVVAGQEAATRQACAEHFPGDHWSQDDDFANWELRTLRFVSGARGFRLDDALRAIDDGLRWPAPGAPPRRATASPCKPRPFYD